MANTLQFKPKTDVGFKPKKIPGTISLTKPEEPQVLKAGREEPTWREAIKEFTFPAKEGYGVRTTPVSRIEKVWRAVEFVPRTGLGVLGGAIERIFSKLPASVIEPPMAAIGKGRFDRIATEELKKWPSSIGAGLKAVVEKPGVPTPKAPGYGEAWARSWREPLTGKPAKEWEKISQDTAFTILTMFGPKAFKDFKGAKLTKADKIVKKYNGRIKIAQAKGDKEAVKSIRAQEQYELARLGKAEEATREAARIVKASEKAPKVAREAVKVARGAPETAREAIEAEKPLGKLVRLIKTATRTEKAQRQLRHLEMQKRVGKYAGILEKRTGKEAFYTARGALKGQLPTAEFTPPQLEMSPAEMNSLIEQLRTTKNLLPLQKGNAFDALQKIFSGKLPQRNELALLEKEFGPELVKAILGKRALSTKMYENIVDIANLPRTFLTSYDLSASMRQTYISGVRHPVKWSKAFIAQLKSLKSEKAAIAIEQSIKNSKHYNSAIQYKLYLPEIKSVSAGMGTRPEEFMSRFARYFPGVKMSERAYITMGNKMRFELWSKYSSLWEGTNKTAADYQALAHYLNAVTGRGNLPKIIEKQGALLNATFFSPRYLFSRFQTAAAPAQMLPGRGSTAVGKIAAGDMTAFVAANMSVLAAIKFYWGDEVDIELNPRSSDFGKIRVGNTRWEMWAGFQPIARHIAQAITGQRKTTTTGKIMEQPRRETAKRFVRSKLAPVPAFFYDWYDGTTYTGEEMADVPIKSQLRQRLIPLAIQDIGDAVAYQGLKEGAITLPAAILGIGATSWEPSDFQKAALLKDEIATKYFGKKWDDLSVISQRAIKQSNPQIEDMIRKAKADKTSVPFVEEMLKKQIKIGLEIQGKLPPNVQKEMKRLYMRISGLNRTISDGWYLNDERYEKYQELTSTYLNRSLPKVMTSGNWRAISDDNKRKLIEEVISTAKEVARTRIIMKAVMDDKLIQRK